MSRLLPAALAWLLICLPGSSRAAELFVDAADPFCGDRAPCFASIQEAIDAADPGDRIRIRSGTYAERLRIRDLNDSDAADEADRIVIERAADAPPDSVVLDGSGFRQRCRSAAIEVSRSRFVTIRGLVVTGFGGPAVRMRGGRRASVGVQIEGNRIVDNGVREPCDGGVVIDRGNRDTEVVNNLIHANRGNGIELRGAGGPQYLVHNTVHGNGRNGIAISRRHDAVLANNAVTGNGVAPRYRKKRPRRGGYGVLRHSGRGKDARTVLLHNLLCGNSTAEVNSGALSGDSEGNLTPTGDESDATDERPECVVPDGVYADVASDDGVEGTLDDDFSPTPPGPDGLPSPLIDAGIDPGTLGFGVAGTHADYLEVDVRPVERDGEEPLAYDVGAYELPCPCDGCSTCAIDVFLDGSSASVCVEAYDTATQCCNRLTGEVDEKHRGAAFDVCPETRVQVPGFDPQSSADGCSAVPDRPFVLCPAVRFGCDEDSGEENCPEGIDLPCNNHDFCYQTCPRDQSECDIAFLNDMLEVCDNMTVGQKILCYDDCVVRAFTYFDGVVAFGADAHRNGQNRACQCCRDLFVAE